MPTIDIPRAQRPFAPEDVLFYYDGPLLFWLPVPGEHLLACALPDEGGPWPFLVSKMSPAVATALQAETLGLREAVLSSENFLLADYGATVLALTPLDQVPEDWLPEPGLFLR